MLYLFDAWVCLLESGCFKGRFAHKQCVHDATSGPNIHFETVSILVQDLGSNIVGGAAQSAESEKVAIEFIFYVFWMVLLFNIKSWSHVQDH